ncbi:hypothetical protein B0I32_106284 [Nonomuraea fuscirosea]|uniref:Uncharacterized protein n=1 Tax=Nonomuraea fuscirosea TaxID=1291556 RepID=A0A2T0N2D3_9ACTN|nr:hypothetical protein B0I32_106284 [Nonomuraea fuscirosea]
MAVDQARRVKASTRQRKAHRLGIKTRRDIAPVIRHLQLLRRTMSIHEIAEAASMDYTSIWKILHGARATVLPATERKILAVAPINGALLLDSTGSRRRVQALATAGWTGEEVGRQVAARRGDAWANITRVLKGQRITASLAHEIAAVYVDLQQQAPPPTTASKRAKERAQRNRWAPPAAWETVNIDDPDALPDWSAVLCEFAACSRPVKPGRALCEACDKQRRKRGTLDGYTPARNGSALVEDALWISQQQGWSLREENGRQLVAERLGVTLDALERSLYRHTNTQAESLAGKEAR